MESLASNSISAFSPSLWKFSSSKTLSSRAGVVDGGGFFLLFFFLGTFSFVSFSCKTVVSCGFLPNKFPFSGVSSEVMWVSSEETTFSTAFIPKLCPLSCISSEHCSPISSEETSQFVQFPPNKCCFLRVSSEETRVSSEETSFIESSSFSRSYCSTTEIRFLRTCNAA